MKILDLACGAVKTKNAIGMDRLDLPGVDVIHDFNEFPYPFCDNTFDRVVSYNGMEHTEQPLEVLAELHRICKDGATIHLTIPHFSSVDSYTDPTHIHCFACRSFDYLIPGTQLADLCYDQVKFKKLGVRLTFFGPRLIRGCLSLLSNKTQMFYERHLAFIIPAHQIIVDLEVLK